VLIDATLPIGIADVRSTARELEQSGYDGLWVGETQMSRSCSCCKHPRRQIVSSSGLPS
jgi:hypothetical protein